MTNISDNDPIYTIADMRKEREELIDRVLEIIDSKKVDTGYIDTVGLEEYMHRLGWNDAIAIIKTAVLALKGEQDDK